MAEVTEASVVEKIGQEFWDKCKPHQKEDILFAIRNNGRVIVADDMGCGKTCTSYGTSLYYAAESYPLLVVTVTTGTKHLANEAIQWLDIPRDQIFIIGVDKISKDKKSAMAGGLPIKVEDSAVPRAEGLEPGRYILVYIVAYDQFRIHYHEIRARAFKIIIADESHKMKHIETARTQLLTPILHQARQCILLSGTPLNVPLDLYPQLHAVRRDLFPDVYAFYKRFCIPEPKTFYDKGGVLVTKTSYKKSSDKQKDDLRQMILRNVVIRHRKRDIEKKEQEVETERVRVQKETGIQTKAKATMGIPPKHRKVVYLKTPEGDACEAFQAPELPKLPQAGPLGGPAILSPEELARMKTDPSYIQVVAKTVRKKIPIMWSYIQHVLSQPRFVSDTKIILVAHHKVVIDALCFMLEDSGLGYFAINGSTTAKHRGELIEAFQTNENCRVAIVSIETCNVCVQMTAASVMLVLEIRFNADVHLQVEDRVHRMGQTKEVEIIYVVWKKSIEGQIFNGTLGRKMGNIAKVLDGETKKDLFSFAEQDWMVLESDIETAKQQRKKLKQNRRKARSREEAERKATEAEAKLEDVVVEPDPVAEEKEKKKEKKKKSKKEKADKPEKKKKRSKEERKARKEKKKRKREAKEEEEKQKLESSKKEEATDKSRTDEQDVPEPVNKKRRLKKILVDDDN